jgi:Protein of unknown function (DUF1207).
MADPRAALASAGMRFDDQVVDAHVIDVSYADIVPIYRWFNIWGGDLELDLEGAMWAVFQPFQYSSPLVNADYYIGGALSWKSGWWSVRLRGYHISSHIGDEFLLNHPDFNRLNPSAEYIDLFVSYYICGKVRVYAGAGYIPFSDESFPFKKRYLEAGAESYIPVGQFYSPCNFVLGRPFFGMHFRWWQNNDDNTDSTYVLGYEFAKLCGLERKVRFYAEYHDGYSLEGQFCLENTDYFALRLSYGY